ncbi:dual adapter for phosphotyrosine and 3-phosphotyrosine and 3-phosphoinositide-like isoform X2 [Halichondria panicea]|uniref:dual adapter for phosphotyrosine and 3-phosphotyrosine and 3-phosphoinositide-like isoform X2 n=1 Tax=Halichondria panicea TaxID=6063 RepID=UPI00312B99D0
MAQAVEELMKQESSQIIVRRQRTTDSEVSDSSAGGTGTGWSPMASTTKFNMLDIPWFHPNLIRHHAEAELGNSEEGVYLLRPKMKGGQVVEGYSLDIRSAHSVKHFRINVHKGSLVFGQETFSDLESFLQHFRNYPLIGDETERRISEEIAANTEAKTYSLVSKEGYLVKLGNVVKTWKRRWFVLKNEELRYFSRDSDKQPIRVINLREVTEVKACDLHPIHRKTNAFRLVLPSRTFFIQAPNPTVRDEWIHVLDFKLNELQEARKRSSTDTTEKQVLQGSTPN